MEPQYMIIGQALGIAAALAREGNTPVQRIDVAALQAKLRDFGAILHEDEANPDWLRASDLPGVVVDNDRAELVGDWKPSVSAGPFVGLDYVHDDNAASSENRARFNPGSLAPGRYEIRLSYSANPNRATRALVRVHTATGVVDIQLDQRAPQGELAPFVRLGQYDIAAGGGTVEIVGSPDSGGVVSADCVQWLPQGP
jgi:hypothetical protein